MNVTYYGNKQYTKNTTIFNEEHVKDVVNKCLNDDFYKKGMPIFK